MAAPTASPGVSGTGNLSTDRRVRRLAAATTTASTAATATASVFARLGFVHRQRAPAVVLAVEPLDGRLGLLVAAHLDEAESLASAAFTVFDDLGTFDVPKEANKASRSVLLTV